MFSTFRGELRSRKIALSTNLAAGLPKIHADPVQLREVLLNLISCRGDERDRRTSACSGHRFKTRNRRCYDYRRGFWHRDRCQTCRAGLRSFFTTKPTGMGMGLAICRSIIAAHNGRLWASPGASSGTVFYVALPLDTGEIRRVGLINTVRYVS
jgi:two-component system, cell cycle sensor histidine kinase and response regulator CckA